jgi:uncharacterized membrane protein
MVNFATTDPRPDRGLMIVLAYLWPLAVVPLLINRHDAEVRWHARHGLALMFAEVLLLAVYVLGIGGVMGFASFVIGYVLSITLIFLLVGIIALHVVAILKGLAGRRLHVPVVTAYANRSVRL